MSEKKIVIAVKFFNPFVCIWFSYSSANWLITLRLVTLLLTVVKYHHYYPFLRSLHAALDNALMPMRLPVTSVPFFYWLMRCKVITSEVHALPLGNRNCVSACSVPIWKALILLRLRRCIIFPWFIEGDLGCRGHILGSVLKLPCAEIPHRLFTSDVLFSVSCFLAICTKLSNPSITPFVPFTLIFFGFILISINNSFDNFTPCICISRTEGEDFLNWKESTNPKGGEDLIP